VFLRVTGKPPANASERLVERIISKDESAPFHWLEEKVSEIFYHTELRDGAWATDIGIYGPTLFRVEAARVLKEIRPEFAHLVPDDETKTAI
jgi:hypothetical protein